MTISAKQLSAEILTTDASKAGVANYNALAQRIVNVSDPVADQDVVTLGSVVSNRITDIWHEMDFTTVSHPPPYVAARTGYYLPLGNMFFPASSECSLDFNGSPRSYGSFFTALLPTPDAFVNVGNVAVGVQLLAVPALGLHGTFRWRERRLQLPPTVLSKVRLDQVASINDNAASSLPTSQPPVPSKIAVVIPTHPMTWSGGSITVFGQHPTGTPVSETFTPVVGQKVHYGSQLFTSITSVSNSAPGGAGVYSAKVILQEPSDYSAYWSAAISSTRFPNAILLPRYPDLQLEFWRLTFDPGGNRGVDVARVRQGRRFVPYRRFAVGQNVVFMGSIDPADHSSYSEMTNGRTKHKHYKVCYYDPATGARSELSSSTIVVAGNIDRNVAGTRQRTSVWIQ